MTITRAQQARFTELLVPLAQVLLRHQVRLTDLIHQLQVPLTGLLLPTQAWGQVQVITALQTLRLDRK